MERDRPVVLVFSDYYLPGYKAGGPIRTTANMVERLGDEFCFKVVTRNHDFGDTISYPGVVHDEWQFVGKAEVFYLSPRGADFWTLRRLICSTNYDLLYLNSFFSFRFSIQPLMYRWARLGFQKPTILAPRGEFSPGAFALKRLKKHAYMALAKQAGFCRDIIWQASSEYEEKDIQRLFGGNVSTVVAPDFPPLIQGHNYPSFSQKVEGRLRVVFVSRISKMKNLYSALMIIKGVKGEVTFDIYGPLEDPEYWSECRVAIHEMPENIKVEYQGALEHQDVVSVMGKYELFFLPSLGENYGHVILEALVAGCPVLVSDRTPWRGLTDKGVGRELPLEQPECFQMALQQFVDMDEQTYRLWSRRAREYGLQCSHSEEVVQENRQLFTYALAR